MFGTYLLHHIFHYTKDALRRIRMQTQVIGRGVLSSGISSESQTWLHGSGKRWHFPLEYGICTEGLKGLADETSQRKVKLKISPSYF